MIRARNGSWSGLTWTRRRVLQGALPVGAGALAIACGGGSEKKPENANVAATAAAGTAAAMATLDPTKGKQGGKIVIQQYGDPGGGLELVKIRNAGVHQFSGFTHDGLLEMRTGVAGSDGYDIETQPNLAQAMPEQPDPLTFVFKLRPAKFHNGRTVTSEDVKYSYELYAFGADSAWKSDMVWLDRVDAPDPQTVVVRSKFAYADAPQAMAARDHLEVLAKEHQESPEAQTKLMGSGPFLFVEYQPPVRSRFRRNPDYHRQPYPYFEEIDFLGTSDTEKKIADFAAHQVHMTYYFPPEGRDRVKQVRPDAQLWSYLRGADALYMRTDKPPFNDKRVRQALSMAIDRSALSKALTLGEGEPDQALSIAGKYWGFRKPSELGAGAKYFEHNVAEAKKLLEAAGVSLPLKFEVLHWNATVVGPQFVDAITLIESQWRSAGIADVKDGEQTFGQSAGTTAIGNYQDTYWGVDPITYALEVGLGLRNRVYWPPEGIKGPPTLNVCYINNPQLSELGEKQRGQFNKQERIQTFRQMEDVLAEEQYWLKGVTTSYNFFGDPSVKNMLVPVFAANGALTFVKYWWFDKG